MYTIPKKIHQTWYKKKLPYFIQRNVTNMKKLNKDYEYYFYDDEDIIRFIKSNYDNEIYEAYSKLTIGASKADFFRYLVLYKEGGIYLDIDSSINKNLDDLIEGKSAVISREGNEGNFLQWMLIFSKNHPILKEVIENVKKNITRDCKQPVVYLAGPPVYTDSINKIIKVNDLWSKKDEEINSELKENSNNYISNTYFFDYDYKEYATFKTLAGLLSLNWFTPHWREEESGKMYSVRIYIYLSILILLCLVIYYFFIFSRFSSKLHFSKIFPPFI